MPARAAAPDVIVIQGDGISTTFTATDIAQLPVVKVTPTFGSAAGAQAASFEGPLLWTVLDHAHAVAPDKHREQVRQMVVLTGQDGYTAALALGEIAPEFEGKQVIVAERMDGKPLEHLRIIVPGDRRGGRSVHDLARVSVMPLPGG